MTFWVGQRAYSRAESAGSATTFIPFDPAVAYSSDFCSGTVAAVDNMPPADASCPVSVEVMDRGGIISLVAAPSPALPLLGSPNNLRNLGIVRTDQRRLDRRDNI